MKIDLKGFRKFAFKRKHLLISIVVFVFVFSVIGSYGYQDPGIRKKGRILIDELHSKWEDTIKPMDKEWYGKLSTYSYYNWAEWLNYYYHVDRNINHTLDASLLKNYDILIIKCPTSLFSAEEINAIVDFVKTGGGLYLIGDHTNVFGMNFYLNKISQHFGIIFRYDSTSHLNNGTLSIYHSQKILPHPIIQYTPRFNFLSSCTLKAPITSENVIIGYGLLSCMGTYTTKHYFRPLTSISPDTEQGVFLQVVAVKYGKGRVVAFTDSTCFSNFCIFMDGYPSFNLMTIEYLNRVNFLDFINNMFFGLAIALFVVLIYLFVRYTKRAMAVFLFILVGLTSFSISVPFFSYINKVNYPLPEPHTNFTKICFVEEYSDFSISSRHASLKVSSEKKFNTFFIWLQRMGYVPYVKKNLQEALRNGDAIVIINPVKHFSERDIKAIKDYLKNGGKVVLIDGILNTDSTANELLNNFNMRIGHAYHREYLNSSINSKNVGIARPYLVIYGGNRTLSDKNGFTYVSFVDYGEGRVVAVVDSSMFSNAIMGGAFTVPDASLMRIYNTEFYIFEDIVFGK
ncbi:hypothetical protein DRO25_03790 [Candidatus Bathyarchaeota archaeon]|nr:MAG: hypothetical protein DRO25_03790 [Candidatus Bathyarchaeota archaeon]